MGINGNHEIVCPHCGHTHYRVVENGRVTGERYRSSMNTIIAPTYAMDTSNNGMTSSNDTWLQQSWNDSTSGTWSIRTGS